MISKSMARTTTRSSRYQTPVAVSGPVSEEGDDGVPTVVRELTGLVRGGSVVGQELAQLGESLGVEEPEVAVLQLTDGFDLFEVHSA
jgi:hypothetical protein